MEGLLSTGPTPSSFLIQNLFLEYNFILATFYFVTVYIARIMKANLGRVPDLKPSNGRIFGHDDFQSWIMSADDLIPTAGNYRNYCDCHD